jgi:glycosyltransferase involved in cell wall biosynthesis
VHRYPSQIKDPASRAILPPRRPEGTYPCIADYVSEPARLTCPKGGARATATSNPIRDGLVSIITVVRNAYTTISRTIDSARTQSYTHLELIVIDGASTDGTLDIIRRRESDIDLWISEPDRGIADAFNKGIALASGEFIALVNADDWIEPAHVARSIEVLRVSSCDFTFGNLMFHDRDDHPMYSVMGDEHYGLRLRHAMPAINHPTIVCRRALYVRNGLFDLHYRIAMDYEWLLRNHSRGAVGRYIPDLTSHMGAGGVSQRHMRASLLEVRRASIAYGCPAPSAFSRYYARLLRAHIRLLLEKLLPRTFIDSIHTVINPSYRRSVHVR